MKQELLLIPYVLISMKYKLKMFKILLWSRNLRSCTQRVNQFTMRESKLEIVLRQIFEVNSKKSKTTKLITQ